MQTQCSASMAASLTETLVDAGSLPLSCMSRQEVADWMCDLQRLRASVDGLLCQATVAADEAAVPVLDSLVSVSSYVAAHTNADPKQVGSDRAMGWWLKDFVLFAEALTAGRITRRHVQAFRSATNRRTHAVMVEAQDYLIEAACGCGWREFVEILRYWVLAMDPDGNEPSHQLDKRRVSASKRADGMVSGSFLLDPLAGDAFLNGLDQECKRIRNRDDAAGTTTRNVAQRRADALVALVSRGTANPNGKTPAPLVHLVMSQKVAEDTLAKIAGIRGATPFQLPLDHGHIDGRCELIDGTPIHPRLATAALAIGVLRRVVMGAESEILDLGRGARCFPRHLKDVLLTASRGRCDILGCDAPVTWLEADHYIPWTRDGATAIKNGGIQCQAHNRLKRDLLPP